MSRDPDGTEEKVADLRGEIDQTRREIDQTVSRIEQRLRPESIRDMMAERVRRATGPWRDRPVEETQALVRELVTRIREMAWMNPVGLGLAAAAAGYVLGRRVAR